MTLEQLALLKKELKTKEETARYLYGKKRGFCWGRSTQADIRREEALQTLRVKIKNLESILAK